MTQLEYKIDLGNVPLLAARLSAGQVAGLKAAGLYVKGVASQYPRVRRLKVNTKLWTVRQRKFFFAALKRGELRVPYTRGSDPRSQRAGPRWASDDSRAEAGQVVVGNNATYARYLYSKSDQAWYHRGNWRDIEQIGRQVGPQARRIIAASTREKLEGR